jgi:hypothetical protein
MGAWRKKAMLNLTYFFPISGELHPRDKMGAARSLPGRAGVQGGVAAPRSVAELRIPLARGTLRPRGHDAPGYEGADHEWKPLGQRQIGTSR